MLSSKMFFYSNLINFPDPCVVPQPILPDVFGYFCGVFNKNIPYKSPFDLIGGVCVY